MNQELKKIKKLYGEAMSKFCRESFSTILEKDGILLELLIQNFEPNHFLYNDIHINNLELEFKNFIYSMFDLEDNLKEVEKTPEELMSEVGYDLYECVTEEEIQSFKKYYAKGEELCTFYGGRLNNCRVFFAVKKDVEEIKRENFKNPERQDRYGTSVISIQFTKDGTNTLSIKNRYNHTVGNPDATFSNNLENIIDGLTNSFEKHYGIIQRNANKHFEIPGYVVANDGKSYKYNCEIDNVYFCVDNIIIDNFEVKKYPKEKYVIFDYFILDLVNKKVYVYNNIVEDSFVEFIKNIKKIEIKNEDLRKQIKILSEDNYETVLKLDYTNHPIELTSNVKKEVKDLFLYKNKTLERLELTNVEIVKSRFLVNNTNLYDLKMPNLRLVGNQFLFNNNSLIDLKLPNLEKVSSDFMTWNSTLTSVQLPNLIEVGYDFMFSGGSLSSLELPSLVKIGDTFMHDNKTLTSINLPKVKNIGYYFLKSNESLEEFLAPQLETIGGYSLFSNKKLKILNLPKLINLPILFLASNECLEQFVAPCLEMIGSNVFEHNKSLKELDLPSLFSVEENFCYWNEKISKVNFPKLRTVGDKFMLWNQELTSLDLPSLESTGSDFLEYNEKLEIINAPKLEYIWPCFCYSNESIKEANLPKLKRLDYLQPPLRKALK